MKPSKPQTIGAANRRAVLSFLRKGGTFTVPELAAATRLSRMTVGKIIDHFMVRKIILAAGKGVSTSEGGKKPEQYRLNAVFARAVGVQVSPDRVEASLGDLGGALLPVLSVPTGPNEKPSSLAKKIAGLCGRLLARTPLSGDGCIGIAVAFPGICDQDTGTVIHSPWFPSWRFGVPLADLTRAHLKTDLPVFLDNEFRFMVQAEKARRDLPEDFNLMVIGGGRGLGSGIISRGGVLRGPHHLAGEIGHMVLQPGGEPCSCGGRGCFEAMVHERRVEKLVAAGARRDSTLRRRGKRATSILPDLFDAAAREEPFALEILDDLAGWFSLAVSNIIVCCDPDMVSIHGVYSLAGDHFLELIRRRVSGIALPSIEKNLAIEFSLLGPDGGIEGAVRHIVDRYFMEQW